MNNSSETILQVHNLSKTFGGLSALRKITMEAQAGHIVGIIGPNGAGKTTLFNCLTGLYHPTKGHIFFKNQSIVPEIPEETERRVHLCAAVFLALSLLWAPIFWSLCFPKTYFKVEITLLTLFLAALRCLVYVGLKQFQIWSWGLAFVWLLSDLYLSARIWIGISDAPNFPGTDVSMIWLSAPWSIPAFCFCIYFTGYIFTKKVRTLFGFRISPDQISRIGISRTFQNIRLFMNLSVLDNVKIGAHGRMTAGVFSTLLNLHSKRAEEQQIELEGMQQLKFVGLDRYAFDLAGSLPYGEQRRLEIARALASKPKLLLLDEPAAGMNPTESSQLIHLIRKIRDAGITIMMIEHDMKVMMNLADRIYVLDHGELIAFGKPEDIKSDPKVIEAYLGKGMANA